MAYSDLKKNIITILFISSVLLILANIVVNKFYHKTEGESEKIELSSKEINSRFIKSIMNYGFDSSWISTTKGRAEQYNYIVNVPPDVPIALLLREIKNSFNPEEADVIVEEKKINGINTLSILSGGESKLSSRFQYKKDISRNMGYAGVVLIDVENLSAEEMSSLLRIPENFGVVLIPSKSSIQLSKKIMEAGKEVIVKLNDDISELEYKLGSDFSPNRIKDVMRSIAGAYPKAVFYIIDASSSLYNSNARYLLEAEFKKRGIKLIPSNRFAYYDGNSGKGLDKLIPLNNEKRIILIPAEYYLTLDGEIERVRKIGFRFINPSLALI
jgi:hypothetical protein